MRRSQEPFAFASAKFEAVWLVVLAILLIKKKVATKDVQLSVATVNFAAPRMSHFSDDF